MRSDYKQWLEKQGYNSGRVTAQLHRVGRVEKHYGDLNQVFVEGCLNSLSSELRYSSDDERQSRPNPSKIPIDGNLRNNLSSYRFAVQLYQKFLSEHSMQDKAGVATRQAIGQILSYMGDMSSIDEDKPIRGVLVASNFDTGALAAARWCQTSP